MVEGEGGVVDRGTPGRFSSGEVGLEVVDGRPAGSSYKMINSLVVVSNGSGVVVVGGVVVVSQGFGPHSTFIRPLESLGNTTAIVLYMLFTFDAALAVFNDYMNVRHALTIGYLPEKCSQRP